LFLTIDLRHIKYMQMATPKKAKAKTIKDICNEIDLIIEGKQTKTDSYEFRAILNSASKKQIKFEELCLVCDTILKISVTKNRTLRLLEGHFWKFINSIPNSIFLYNSSEFGDCEELLPNADYPVVEKKILSRLLGLVAEILALKDDYSNGSGLRRSEAIQLYTELLCIFEIPSGKSVLVNSVKSKNKTEQYAALMGLGDYYGSVDDEIDDDLVDTLDEIVEEHKTMAIIDLCIIIKSNAGIYDEFSDDYDHFFNEEDSDDDEEEDEEGEFDDEEEDEDEVE